jgi:hypothetical protein
MNGGTIRIQPKSMAISDRVGLMDSSCSKMRRSSFTFQYQYRK